MIVVYALGGLSDKASLSTDLCGDFIMRKTRRGEDGDLLPTGDGIHGVDGGDTRGDHFFRIHLGPVSGEVSSN